MKKPVWALVACILCLHVKFAYSQKSDYLATDSSIMVGIKFEPSTPRFNSQYIKLKSKNGGTVYHPEQVREYGFKDGTVYETRKIVIENEERKVFLERLVKGNITLFRYVDSSRRNFYYLEKDSSDLQELGKDLEALKAISQDCEFIADPIRLASYSKGSLRKLVTQYNKCENKPFPFKKIGILAGWRSMSLTQPSGLKNSAIKDVSIPSSSSPVIGFFADIPIDMSQFSLHPELFYTGIKFAANSNTSQSDLDVLISLNTLQMPVLVRYTVPTPSWRVFANAGPYFSYNLKNSSDVYYAQTTGNTVTIERPIQEKLVADFMLGYSAGVGLQRQLNYRKTLSAECRFTWAAGSQSSTLIQKGIDLVFGFTF